MTPGDDLADRAIDENGGNGLAAPLTGRSSDSISATRANARGAANFAVTQVHSGAMAPFGGAAEKLLGSRIPA